MHQNIFCNQNWVILFYENSFRLAEKRNWKLSLFNNQHLN